ncbi:MAG: hypothetical protein AAB462_03715 [Patescibacteria group bacterium]
MSGIRSPEVTVYTHHELDNGLSVAFFEWDKDGPKDTYPIDVNESLAVRLDSHVPVRPDTITLLDTDAERSAEALTTLVGEELTEAMLQAKRIGVGSLRISLSPENRQAIAGLQVDAENTPIIVRELAKSISHPHDELELSRHNMFGLGLGRVSRTRGSQKPGTLARQSKKTRQ